MLYTNASERVWKLNCLEYTLCNDRRKFYDGFRPARRPCSQCRKINFAPNGDLTPFVTSRASRDALCATRPDDAEINGVIPALESHRSGMILKNDLSHSSRREGREMRSDAFFRLMSHNVQEEVTCRSPPPRLVAFLFYSGEDLVDCNSCFAARRIRSDVTNLTRRK